MSKNNPKLSIITINFNDCEGLRQTIQSVACQTYKNFEYIVIDGASTDGSAHLLEEYKNIIDFGISEKDTGIYNAMNKGASYAHGKYLLFLNSGDVLHSPNTLSEAKVDEFNTDIVSGLVINYSNTDAKLKIPPFHISLFTFTGGSLPHPSSFILNDLFKRVGGYHESYRIISDWCFFVEATIQYKCSYSVINNIITNFNRRGISSTVGYTEDEAKIKFLEQRFGPIINDYTSSNDEALNNVVFWISSKKGFFKTALSIPFKIINRLLHLRNKLGRRMGIRNISYDILDNQKPC